MNILKIIVIAVIIVFLLSTIPSLMTPILSFLETAFGAPEIAYLIGIFFDMLTPDMLTIIRVLLAAVVVGFIVDLIRGRR